MAQLQTDSQMLRAALVGYQYQLSYIASKMAEIQKQIGGKHVSASAEPIVKRRALSAAARRRIGAAQRKRWAAFHAAQGPTAKAVPARAAKRAGKRRLSAEGRRRIAEAAKKRWSAIRAAKAVAASA